ncbi:murein hydrolase activator EnvC family protein [Halpernia frigidisoli]|uniref:Septal ring factor EnvC, activator of murein hydrolases AmiA and AmiB n=1 Tax=Halpernia frigidisoli TaxID=1125876 RepID=A0A1I3GF72_9FLAO|nr:peptidoglycan DD-metalloendopeptidase family protein [Halpernia frigidisoli]SFI22109.1 Septal ring factor EnvC, activator of murein hydrolases AmiA and AmiB [Halpernia frigidisoli]
MHRKILIFIGLLLLSQFSAQKKEQLQQQNADLKKQISLINANLAKTKNESKLSVAYLNAVNQKIDLRQKVFTNTQKEKRFIEDDIYLRQLEINRQNRELVVLRKNYAAVLVNAYKNKGVQNKVTFILSSKNLGEALRRVQYLKQYSDYQDKKSAEITDASVKIKTSIASRQKSMQEKENLLSNQEKDLKTISVEKQQKEKLLADFKANETQLTAELKQKQIQSNALEGKIRNLINEEIRLAKIREEANKKAEAEKVRLAKLAADREKARIDAENKARADALEKERIAADLAAKKALELANRKADDERKRSADAAKADASARDEERRVAASKDAAAAANAAKIAQNKAVDARAAEVLLEKNKNEAKKVAETKANTSYGVNTNLAGNNFVANRGKMSLPVRGTITHRFGRQPHPIFKNIWEDNNGIKIAVSPGTKAQCVFPGVVTGVMVDGNLKTVIVKHGDYFTVYSNLSNVNVSSNQQVAAGTAIGQVGTDFDGTNTLDFQIWNGSNPVDPLGWISY